MSWEEVNRSVQPTSTMFGIQFDRGNPDRMYYATVAIVGMAGNVINCWKASLRKMPWSGASSSLLSNDKR